MALLRTFTKFGYTFPAAYSRVASYDGNKVSTSFVVDTYTCAAARETGEAPIYSQDFQATYAADLLPSLYAFVKQQPDFVDAVDA